MSSLSLSRAASISCESRASASGSCPSALTDTTGAWPSWRARSSAALRAAASTSADSPDADERRVAAVRRLQRHAPAAFDRFGARLDHERRAGRARERFGARVVGEAAGQRDDVVARHDREAGRAKPCADQIHEAEPHPVVAAARADVTGSTSAIAPCASPPCVSGGAMRCWRCMIAMNRPIAMRRCATAADERTGA